MPPALSNTFVMDFKHAGESFCIFGNRIYVLQESNSHENSPDFLKIGSKKFSLRQSETVSRIESIYFTLNKPEVEKIISSYITTNFLSKLAESEKRLVERNNYYLSLQESTIERILKHDVLKFYEEAALEKLDTPVQIQQKKIQEINSNPEAPRPNPTVNDLNDGTNSLCDILQDKRVLVIGSGYYYLVPVQTKDLAEIVSTQGDLFRPAYAGKVEDLEKAYLISLVKKMEKKAAEHGSMLLPRIKANTEQVAALNNEINRQENSKDRSDFGSYGFRKKEYNVYEVYIKIEPYVIKRDGMYFEFPKVKVGNDIKVSSNSITLCNYPKVLEPKEYWHMFVYPDGEFCYRSGTTRWEQRGIKFGRPYTLDSEYNKKIAAKAIALALFEGWNIIHKGYDGDPNPVHLLPDQFMDQKISIAEAKRKRLKVYDNEGRR